DLFTGTQAEVTAVDKIDGGDGYDVLTVSEVTGTELTDGVETVNVERVNLGLAGEATVDASKFVGVEGIVVSGGEATLSNLSTDTTVVLGSNHNINLGLAEAQAEGESFNLMLNAGGLAGTITDSNAAGAEAIKNLTIIARENATGITLAASS